VNLTELFRNPKLAINEGGNVSNQSPGWQGVPGDHQAQELDLHVHDRAYVQDVVSQLLHTINDVYAQQHQEPLWHENSVKTQKFLSGSTLQFMDKNIPDEEFIRVKPKVGDIDTQASDQHADTIKQFLQSNTGKAFGNAVLLGFTPGNSQWVSLWEIKLKDLPVKIQIDFEYGAHEKETGLPTEWQSYSHSSAWDDISQNIKGVFHKYLDRALPYAQASTKYVARVLKKSTKISDAPVTDSDYSFAVSGPGGGGVSQKYVPYNDPATGQPMEKDGIPVMQLLEPSARQYVQNLSQQFEIFFGRKPKGNDQELKNSFIGTIQLIAKYLDEQKKEEIARRFFSICFEPGSQMITRGDPARDRDIKFAAIDWMLENMKLANAAGLRKEAIDMATAYAAAFQNKAAKPVNEEAQVKAQFRKGMPHLHDLKPADLLDLLDEIHDGNGRFKLQNIPLNVKVDGFGGRFGKNSDGKPFMGTSRTEPRYEPGFVAYHQKKGTVDPEILNRAQLFDDLFEEMMNAVQLVDSKLGPGFLVNKQVTCEVLYLPFATETPEGKLKFVGIHYDKLPSGVNLALVPFRITDATTGEDLPNSNKIVQELTSVGQSGSVMFIDNSLTQNEALDVTALVPPLENIEQLKGMLASNKLEARRQVKAALEPVAAALEKAIIEDPNIIGKDLLGQDYEGIVINSRLGPIKVTSQEQRDVITAKNAAKTNARTERPRGEAKTAVVAIGSFVGHIGHEQLWDYTTKKAAAVGGDPYLFIGNAQGKDDPIPPSVKVQTWHKLYPEYAKNISTVNQDGGSLLQKIKHELINPLPGKPPRYDNVIIMVGEDQAGLTMPQALMKAVNKFQGYEHVKVTLEPTPRGTGMSFTRLRNILKDPKATPDQQFAEWSKGFDVSKLGADWILHLMDITRKGMGIQQPQAPVPQAQPTPLAERRVLNALIEGTSIDSTLRAIINDVGEPITNVYGTMKFQAKKYMENHGELGRGFRMVAAGVGGRWVQNMYVGRLQNELYDLCKYNTRRTVDLQEFLRGVETDGELEMKRSFGNIANNLPPILAKLGEQINAPQLTRNAQRWMQNKAEYERYLMDLEAAGDEPDDIPVRSKPPKSNAVGQQNAQVDSIINNVLGKVPKSIAGDIRNAIARAPNKLAALKAELDRHNINMAEDNDVMSRMARDLTGPGAPDAKRRAQRDQQRQQDRAQSDGRDHGPKWDVEEGEQDPQSELKLINQKLKDAYKQVRNNSSVSIGWYMSEVKALKARREELIKQLRQGVAEAGSPAQQAAIAISMKKAGKKPKSEDISLNELSGYGGDKKYEHLGTHKRYEVYVTKQKFNNLYFIAIAENTRTLESKFKAKGNTPQEAVNNLKLEIDKEIDVATKVSGQAILDFNVDFVKDILEMSSDTFYAKIVAGPRLVIAGPEMMEYPEIMRDEGFKPSAIRTYKGGEGTTKLPGVPLSSKSAASANLIANGRYVLGNEELDKDGNRVFELNFDSVVQASNDKMRLRAPALTVGTNRSQGVSEAPKSAAVRLGNAIKRVQGTTAASQARSVIPSSIPKPEPKKDEKTNERMMPASMFAGSKKNKLGPAGQWKNTGPKKNKPAQAGDLVGGMEESLKDSNPCWKGYHPVGTKKKSGKTVPNCVPVSENVENIMDALINKIVVNEAIQNNRK